MKKTFQRLIYTQYLYSLIVIHQLLTINITQKIFYQYEWKKKRDPGCGIMVQ